MSSRPPTASNTTHSRTSGTFPRPPSLDGRGGSARAQTSQSSGTSTPTRRSISGARPRLNSSGENGGGSAVANAVDATLAAALAPVDTMARMSMNFTAKFQRRGSFAYDPTGDVVLAPSARKTPRNWTRAAMTASDSRRRRPSFMLQHAEESLLEAAARSQTELMVLQPGGGWQKAVLSMNNWRLSIVFGDTNSAAGTTVDEVDMSDVFHVQRVQDGVALFTFVIITTSGRKFEFASFTESEGSVWVDLLRYRMRSQFREPASYKEGNMKICNKKGNLVECRWCVLSDTKLSHYKSVLDPVAGEEISLEDILDVSATVAPDMPFCIELQTAKVVFQLGAPDVQFQSEWVEAIWLRVDSIKEMHVWGNNMHSKLGMLTQHKTILEPRPLVPFLGTCVSQASCGSGHAAAVMDDGRLFVWGCNDNGQVGSGVCGDLPPTLVEALDHAVVTSVACGVACTAATTDDGELYIWGNTHELDGDEPSAPYHWSPAPMVWMRGLYVKGVALGLGHAAAVTDTGMVYTWGSGAMGQLGHGRKQAHGRPQVVDFGDAPVEVWQVACGYWHTVVVTEFGLVYSWGRGHNGQLGHGGKQDILSPEMVEVLAGEDIDSIACGGNHTAACSKNGTLFTWGHGDDGQLGHGGAEGTWGSEKSPKAVKSLAGVSIGCVSCGERHTCAVSLAGSVYVWGYGPALGLGSDKSEGTPVEVRAALQHRAGVVACGSDFTLALLGRHRWPGWRQPADHCDECGSDVQRLRTCRSCKLELCFMCASRAAPLPGLGFTRPVRLCDECDRVRGEHGQRWAAAGLVATDYDDGMRSQVAHSIPLECHDGIGNGVIDQVQHLLDVTAAAARSLPSDGDAHSSYGDPHVERMALKIMTIESMVEAEVNGRYDDERRIVEERAQEATEDDFTYFGDAATDLCGDSDSEHRGPTRPLDEGDGTDNALDAGDANAVGCGDGGDGDDDKINPSNVMGDTDVRRDADRNGIPTDRSVVVDGGNDSTDAAKSIKQGSRVVFLDVDGVLVTRRCYSASTYAAPGQSYDVSDDTLYHDPCGQQRPIEKRCVDLLNRVVRSTGAVIVLSSSWRRESCMREFLMSALEQHSTTLRDAVRDSTPSLGVQGRGKEISVWLQRHPECQYYVVFDDEHQASINAALPPGHLVVTSLKTGLTQADADTAVGMLLGIASQSQIGASVSKDEHPVGQQDAPGQSSQGGQFSDTNTDVDPLDAASPLQPFTPLSVVGTEETSSTDDNCPTGTATHSLGDVEIAVRVIDDSTDGSQVSAQVQQEASALVPSVDAVDVKAVKGDDNEILTEPTATGEDGALVTDDTESEANLTTPIESCTPRDNGQDGADMNPTEQSSVSNISMEKNGHGPGAGGGDGGKSKKNKKKKKKR